MLRLGLLWPLWLLAGLPVLYLLDLWQRRPQRRVLPSLMLLQSLPAGPSSAPVRRRGWPSRHFWLQAAALVCVSLGLCQLRVHGALGRPLRVLCLLESGAAMAAVDAEGRTRAEEARQILQQTVAGWSGWQLEWVELTGGAPPWVAGLERSALYGPWLAEARQADLALAISDRGGEIPAELVPVGVGLETPSNLAITALEAAGLRVFVRVDGPPVQPARALELRGVRADGTSTRLARLQVTGASAEVLQLDLGPFVGLEARLQGSDALAVDDLVFAGRQSAETLTVAVDAGLPEVERVLALLPAVRRSEPDSAWVRFTTDPAAPVRGVRVLFRNQAGEAPRGALSWVPHPVWPSLPADPLEVWRGSPLPAESTAALLVDAAGRVWIGERAGNVEVGFLPRDSSFPKTAAFPIFFAELLDSLRQRRGGIPAWRAGSFVARSCAEARRAPGLYPLPAGGWLGCGVLDRQESALGSFRRAPPASPPEAPGDADSSARSWLLMLALALILCDQALHRPRR